MRLFQKQKASKAVSHLVPSGLIAHTEKGYFYIKNKKKFKFVSDKAMKSWGLPVIETKESHLAAFTLFGTLGFRDGTLVKDISDGKIYLISDSKARHITDPVVLEWFDTEVVNISNKEILSHEEGEDL
jgi:hypothetical protein